jgi:hypothetical protein
VVKKPSNPLPLFLEPELLPFFGLFPELGRFPGDFGPELVDAMGWPAAAGSSAAYSSLSPFLTPPVRPPATAMQLTAIATILSLATLGVAQQFTVTACVHGKSMNDSPSISHATLTCPPTQQEHGRADKETLSSLRPSITAAMGGTSSSPTARRASIASGLGTRRIVYNLRSSG